MLRSRIKYASFFQILCRDISNEYEIGAKNVTAQADEDTRFIASVIELVSLLRNRQYEGDITIESILAELDGLTLVDPYKTEFRELVRALVSQ